MPNPALLKVDGEVERSMQLCFADFESLSAEHQVRDVTRLGAKRPGDAVRLAGLLELVGAKPAAKYLNLHSSADNFHASIPLDAVRERALVIFRRDGLPLPIEAGGPIRFFIPDHATCHTAEIDECANVKFVDHVELTTAKGLDNRPHDEKTHAELHAAEHAPKT